MLNLLQSQLAFYGAIDDAVVHAQQGGGENSDEVLRTVEAMLPGITGFGQAGWYRELEDFANRPGVRTSDVPVTFPSLTDSLAYLAAPTAASREQVAVAAFQGNLDPEREKLAEHVSGSYFPDGDPVLARCAYAAMVLEQITQLGGLPPTLTTHQDAPPQIMANAINAWGGSPQKLTDHAVKSKKGSASADAGRRGPLTGTGIALPRKKLARSLPISRCRASAHSST